MIGKSSPAPISSYRTISCRCASILEINVLSASWSPFHIQASLEPSELSWQQVRLGPAQRDRSFKKSQVELAWPPALSAQLPAALETRLLDTVTHIQIVQSHHDVFYPPRLTGIVSALPYCKASFRLKRRDMLYYWNNCQWMTGYIMINLRVPGSLFNLQTIDDSSPEIILLVSMVITVRVQRPGV